MLKRSTEPTSVFCGRCAHPLPDETQSFCTTCGAAFSLYPPTVNFALIVEHQLETAARKTRHKQVLVIGGWLALCLTVFVSVGNLFRQNKLQSMRPDRDIEFYVANMDGYPAVPSYINRDAVLVALQSFEDHFGIKIKNWKMIEDQVPSDVSTFINSLPTEKISDLAQWQIFYRKKLMPDWHQNPYQPLRVFITNIPLHAPDFLKMETRHLSASKLVGGFANPAFVLISSYRMLTELHEEEPAKQEKYLGEFLIAHELGHALLGLPDFVSQNNFQEFSARGLASVSESPYKRCLMHTDEGGGLTAWHALRDRPLRQEAMCYSYQELLHAYEIRRQGMEAAQSGDTEGAVKRYNLALELLPTDRSLAWVKDLWQDERQLISRY